MGNTATALDAVPAYFRIGKPLGLIYPVLVSMDTTAADLEVFDPGSDQFWAIHGMLSSEATAHTLLIKSGSTALVTLEHTTYKAFTERISPHPLLIGVLGEKLNFNLSAGTLGSVLVYLSKMRSLDLHQ